MKTAEQHNLEAGVQHVSIAEQPVAPAGTVQFLNEAEVMDFLRRLKHGKPADRSIPELKILLVADEGMFTIRASIVMATPGRA